MCGTCGLVHVRHPIRSQHALVSSVGKTPSFSFCQVDMYAIPCELIIGFYAHDNIHNFIVTATHFEKE